MMFRASIPPPRSEFCFWCFLRGRFEIAGQELAHLAIPWPLSDRPEPHRPRNRAPSEAS